MVYAAVGCLAILISLADVRLWWSGQSHAPVPTQAQCACARQLSSVHRSAAFRAIMRAQRVAVQYLPPYSPDLNPVCPQGQILLLPYQYVPL